MTTSDKKNKHMQLEDRIEIQECLCKGMTFKAIANRIGKDPTTVSKEVKLHALEYSNGFTKTNTTCPKLLKAPFVCNGCSKIHCCGGFSNTAFLIGDDKYFSHTNAPEEFYGCRH